VIACATGDNSLNSGSEFTMSIVPPVIPPVPLAVAVPRWPPDIRCYPGLATKNISACKASVREAFGLVGVLLLLLQPAIKRMLVNAARAISRRPAHLVEARDS